jgi:hypothetical protein
MMGRDNYYTAMVARWDGLERERASLVETLLAEGHEALNDTPPTRTASEREFRDRSFSCETTKEISLLGR